MCFYINKDIQVSPQIAQQNIPVFKVLEGFYGGLYSPFMSEPYTLGEVKKALNPIKVEHGEINDGLHTYRKAKLARQVAKHYPELRTVYRAYIPKGATYFMNEIHYVSSELVVTKEYKATLEERIKRFFTFKNDK